MAPEPTVLLDSGPAPWDAEAVRRHLPGLADGAARFDGPGGSMTPDVVAAAVTATMTAGLCQRGTVTTSQRATEAVVAEARAAMGDLLDSDPAGVVFGRSMTALTLDLARTLAHTWRPGDEVVVTRLDHDANVRPWVIAAERAGATVRFLGFDPVTGELDDPAAVMTERTRLVAVTAASNLIGTRPDVAAVAAAAHAVGALVFVDAVHLAAHDVVSRTALGADVVACSPYKLYGPHLGALAADPAWLETLRPDKLLPSTDAVPERFELGTLPYELLAGVTAAVDFVASWGSGPTRRDALESAFAAQHTHETALLDRLLTGVADLPHVTRCAAPARATPTALLGVEGMAPTEASERLAADGVHAPAGHFYAIEASRHLGLGETGGVRVGLAPYTTEAEVDRLLDGLAALA